MTVNISMKARVEARVKVVERYTQCMEIVLKSKWNLTMVEELLFTEFKIGRDFTKLSESPIEVVRALKQMV